VEFKWDGVRAVAYVTGGTVRVLSRNDLDVSLRYPELGDLAGLLGPGRRAVLDGEIVALDERARPSFALLQQRMNARLGHVPRLLGAVPVVYLVFDVLHLDDWPLLAAPYELRRAELADLRLDRAGGRVAVPPHLVGEHPPDVLAAARDRGLEGVVTKRLGSLYRPGVRSRDWVKTRLQNAQEVVVIGWKPGQGRRAGMIGSLLFAVPAAETGELAFAGHVGTGFTDAALRDLADRLAPLRRATVPVGGEIPREHTRGVQWVEPVLVGEVAYATWAPDGLLRHPSWRGLRPDRGPHEVRRGT
jgi:bifunctional non-homologous end joining protein LigD